MIDSNDSIRYTNVVSKRCRFHYKDIDEVIKSFLEELVNQKLTVKGPLFYSINNVPMDEIVDGELFMPIQEDDMELKEDMNFHSYFSIEGMISICINTQFERLTEVAYRVLLDYIEDNKLSQATPIFHIISGDRSLQYVFIKIGVYKKPNE